jgi:hypothetical protein
MSADAPRLDVVAALRDPAAVFGDPQDVLKRQDLSRETKLKVLQQWASDALELSTAEYEGMTGGEESMLGRVRHAIAMLAADSPDRGGTTRS